MSAQTVKDPIRFAREAVSLKGEIALVEMDRLRDELAGDQGFVTYRLEGALVGGRPALRLQIDANPTLVCQVCLTPYVHSLHSEGMIFLARNDAELERWESNDPLLDVIVAEEHMDVRMLVEDELLLSLPVIPRHEDEDCPRRDDVLGEH
jgi:uncharacterized protein